MATAAPVPACVFCSPKDPFLLSFPTIGTKFYKLIFLLLLAPFWLLLLHRNNGCAAEKCLRKQTTIQEAKRKLTKKQKTKPKTPQQMKKSNEKIKTNKHKRENPKKPQKPETKNLTHFPFITHSTIL